jgi:hypothetical protein
MSQAKSAERVVRDIRRKTRRRFSAEEKIRIILEGLRGEESIAALCASLRPATAPLRRAHNRPTPASYGIETGRSPRPGPTSRHGLLTSEADIHTI